MNPTRTRRAAPVTALVLAVLTLVACGDDDDDADTTTTPTEASTPAPTADTGDTGDTGDTEDTEDTATTATSGTTDGTTTAGADDYVAAAAGAIGFADTEISECLARELVDGIGIARIEASGLSPEEFTDAPSLAEIDLAIEAEEAQDVQDAMADCGDLVEAYLESSDVTEEEADCARAELTNDLMAEWLVTGISELPRSEELDATVAALQECDSE